MISTLYLHMMAHPGLRDQMQCEQQRELCVAIVTVTNLTPGFLPSMASSYSAALPLLLSKPPLHFTRLSIRLFLFVSISHYILYSFIKYLANTSVRLF